MPGSDEDRAMHDEIEERAGRIRQIQGKFAMKGWKLRVFPSYGEEDNALSMVMELASGGCRILFSATCQASRKKCFCRI